MSVNSGFSPKVDFLVNIFTYLSSEGGAHLLNRSSLTFPLIYVDDDDHHYHNHNNDYNATDDDDYEFDDYHDHGKMR